MVAAALDALVGGSATAEALAAALATVPLAELPATLRLLAVRHGAAGVGLVGRCLQARADWAVAAADALATVPSQAAADVLAAAERGSPPKAVRTALRRALYRLRQAGITPVPEPAEPRRTAAVPVPRQAWMSAVDGTGSRGCWLVLEGPLGERTLLSAVLNDVSGVLEFVAGPMAKKRLDERLRAIRAESPLPWVEVPPGWFAHLVGEARRRHAASGAPPPPELARWLPVLEGASAEGPPPIYARLPAESFAGDPAPLDASARLLELPELAGWFLDPPAVQSEAVELLQAKESRLVVSEQIKEERRAALVDRTIEAHFEADTRRLWQRRLEEQAFVLDETERREAARQAVAVALALADPDRPARRIPFVRALVERSLEVAGEVALGRLPATEVRRVPPPRRAAAR